MQRVYTLLWCSVMCRGSYFVITNRIKCSHCLVPVGLLIKDALVVGGGSPNSGHAIRNELRVLPYRLLILNPILLRVLHPHLVYHMMAEFVGGDNSGRKVTCLF